MGRGGRNGVGIAVALAVVPLMIMVGGPVPRAAAEPPRAVDPGRIDAYLSRALEATRLPGLAVAVVRRDRVVHVAGYGRDGAGAPVTAATPFRIASLSKSFTAVAVHRLAEAGRIDLDAPVETYLPEFALTGPAAPIRIRELLQQRSGLADSGYPGLLDDQPRDPAERIRLLRGAHQVSRPGTEFHYTDVNYQVLARVIEIVSGEPYERYLAEHVTGPLGLAHTTSATTSATPVPGLAPGHVLVYGEPVTRPEQTGLLGGEGLLAGSGGVVSTADDLARWLRFNLGDGAPLIGDRAMTELHTPASPNGYAEGWQAITPAHGPRRLEHTGILSGYSAVQELLPDSGYGFALLYNGNSMEADTASIVTGLADLLTGAEPALPRDTRLLAYPFGVATLLLVAWRIRSAMIELRGRGRRRSWLRLGLGSLWLLLPAVIIGAAPALLELAMGRVFSRGQLALAVPDPAVFFVLAAVSGVVLAALRIGNRATGRDAAGVA